MAPNLADSQHDQIRDMVLSKSLTTVQMADIAGCSTRSIKAIRSNLRYFGTTKAPLNGVGRPRCISPSMLEALREYLLGRWLLWIGQRRRLAGWRERNADLRDLYLHNIPVFRSYHLVYVDESGCDKRIGFGRTGWSPVGVTPVRIAQFQREQRYRILPAYTQDGVILARVFQGFTDSTLFEDFIEQLLPLCGRWPEPNSVLVMDNASFHHTEDRAVVL
ncbi:hypothetical protein BofuT4_P085440.1 [Botrytis cinerea T4]|uniref:Tc1-like transposase DDE domain-containing protein n=1 Tax=Botryotinia fuckeliana (strain T4) TaxID=999810 RepID=G2YHJ5_BOTF4|nr:hypothetical protein BofuT4_P085440.1 [Botrytis cinerea T4]